MVYDAQECEERKTQPTEPGSDGQRPGSELEHDLVLARRQDNAAHDLIDPENGRRPAIHTSLPAGMELVIQYQNATLRGGCLDDHSFVLVLRHFRSASRHLGRGGEIQK